MTAFKRLAARILILAAALAASIGIAEIGLRCFPPKGFARLANLYPLMRPDPLMGYTLRPNRSVTVEREDGQAGFLVETNEEGLRDVPYHHENGRTVILGLGDSFLFGDGVNRDEAFLAKLEKLLNAAAPSRFKTINAGTPGYSTNQEILYYLDRGAVLFRPDLVILFYYNNDVALYVDTDVSRIRFYEGIPVPETRLLPEGFLGQQVNLQTWRFARYVLHARTADQPTGSTWRKASLNLGEMRMMHRAFIPHQDRWIGRFGEMADILNRKAQANGAKLMVVYLPAAFESEEGSAKKSVYEKYTFPPSYWDWDRMHRELGGKMKSLNVAYVTLLPAFRNHWKTTGRSLYFNGQGHFTQEGHDLAAKCLLPAVLKLEGLDTPPSSAETECGSYDREDTSAQVFGRRIQERIQRAKTSYLGWVDVAAQRVILISDTTYRSVLKTRAVDPVRSLRFYIHPQSFPFNFGLVSGREFYNKLLAPAPGGWREIDIGLGFPGESSVEISIQPFSANKTVVVTEPQMIYPSSRRRPPVVLVALDGLRPDNLPFYNSSAPSLADLSQKAFVFEDVTSPSSEALSSHISLLTGLDPYAHQMISGGSALREGVVTLQSVLEADGYATAAVINSTYDAKKYMSTFQNLFVYPDTDPGQIEASSGRLTEFLGLHRDVAFFLFYQIHHVPGGDELSTLVSALKESGVFDSSLLIVTAGYGASVSNDPVRRTDHGLYQEMLRVPLLIKLPAHLSKTLGRIARPVGLVDVMPTVLDILNLPQTALMNGQSLMAYMDETPLDGDPTITNREFYICHTFQAGGPRAALRCRNYKIILNPGFKDFDQARVELYDLSQDPGERQNLAKNWGGDRRIAEDLMSTFLEAANYRVQVR